MMRGQLIESPVCESTIPEAGMKDEAMFHVKHLRQLHLLHSQSLAAQLICQNNVTFAVSETTSQTTTQPPPQ